MRKSNLQKEIEKLRERVEETQSATINYIKNLMKLARFKPEDIKTKSILDELLESKLCFPEGMYRWHQLYCDAIDMSIHSCECALKIKFGDVLSNLEKQTSVVINAAVKRLDEAIKDDELITKHTKTQN